MDPGKDADKTQKYEEDDRTPCKYGIKCYQKNPVHHKKFKHPPKNEKENKEVISKKRKSPEDSESSSSNTPKVKKLDTPNNEKDSSNEKNSSDKTEDAKEDKNSTNEESNSTEVTKKDSDDVIKSDSVTEKVTSDETGTNTDEKSANSETEAPSEKTNETNAVNSFSNTKDNEEKMDTEEKDTEEKDTEEKGTEEKDTEEKGTEEKDVVEKNTEEKGTEEKDVVEKNMEEKDAEEKNTEEKDTKLEVKNTDVAIDKKTEINVDKVEKVGKIEEATDKTTESEADKVGKIERSTDVESEVCDTEEKDSKKPNNKEKKLVSPKHNSQEKKTNINTEISMNDNYNEAKKLIEKAFLVPMPSDFYKFYDFCRDLKPVDPSTALKIAELKLVGPYDVLNGVITKEIVENTNLLTHWRYYYDPPEFQTVIKGNDREGLHFGYWRDRPSSDPVFVATNCSNVSHKIKPVAENIFGAVAYYFEEKSKKANPFERSGFSSILGKLKNFAKKHNISLETQSVKMKSREKNVVARTIHGAGVVCPYNKKSQLGYRELSVTDNQLLKIVKKLDDAQSEEERLAARSELGEVVRLATIAGDECDFGTCLELGHDLLSTGCFHVQNAALAVLSIAYNQLDRQAFLQIVEAHLKNRKKSSNTSALENVSKE